jgi:signal peptidase II
MKVNPDATLILVVISVCIALDQATKGLARKYLAPDGFVSFAGDTFRLQYAENTGAFLSLGSSLPEPWRHIVFTVLVGIFLLALLAFVFFHRSTPKELTLFLALLCAGGLGNLIDRIAYSGRVVDFLNVGVGPLRTGIFNIADMAITGGAIFLFIDNFRRKPDSQPSA